MFACVIVEQLQKQKVPCCIITGLVSLVVLVFVCQGCLRGWLMWPLKKFLFIPGCVVLEMKCFNEIYVSE